MSSVPESSGFAWACGGRDKHPQGFHLGEESEEGEEPLLFSLFFGGLIIDANIVPKSDQNGVQKGPQKCAKITKM